MRKTVLLALIMGMASFLQAVESKALREEFVTPHWEWETASSEKPLEVLFLTNNLAAYEPEELARRFPGIKPLVAPVIGDSYKNTFEGKWLTDALNSKLDLIVVTARELLRDLQPELKVALIAKLKAGTPLLCLVDDSGWRAFLKEQFDPDGPALANARDWAAFLKAHPGVERGDQLGRQLPLGALKLRSAAGKLNFTEFKIDKGSFHWVAGYDLAWVYPNGLTPNIQAECLSDYETAMALAARMIRFAAGVSPDSQVKTLEVSDDAAVFTFDRSVTGKLRWELYTEFCDRLASGAETLEGSEKTTVRISHGRGGKQFLRWSLETGGRLQDFGMSELKLSSPASFVTAVVPEFNRRGEPVDAAWTLRGEAGEAVVRGEVLDPDGRLMARFVVPAKDGKASIAAWLPAFVTHELRLMLVSGDNVWDERRLELNVQADRSEDPRRFNVTIWDEGVYNVSRWRLRRLRMLGVDAMADPGLSGVVLRRTAPKSGERLRASEHPQQKQIRSRGARQEDGGACRQERQVQSFGLSALRRAELPALAAVPRLGGGAGQAGRPGGACRFLRGLAGGGASLGGHSFLRQTLSPTVRITFTRRTCGWGWSAICSARSSSRALSTHAGPSTVHGRIASPTPARCHGCCSSMEPTACPCSGLWVSAPWRRTCGRRTRPDGGARRSSGSMPEPARSWSPCPAMSGMSVCFSLSRSWPGARARRPWRLGRGRSTSWAFHTSSSPASD